MPLPFSVHRFKGVHRSQKRRSPFSSHPAGWPAGRPLSEHTAFTVQLNGIHRSIKRRSAFRKTPFVMSINTPHSFHTASFNTTMPYSDYLKRRAIVFHERGLSSRAIIRALAREGLKATRQGIESFLKRYETTGSIKGLGEAVHNQRRHSLCKLSWRRRCALMMRQQPKSFARSCARKATPSLCQPSNAAGARSAGPFAVVRTVK